MLLHGTPGPIEDRGMSERCQPDYEFMIERVKNQLDKAVPFRDAALKYCEGIRVEGDMATLIGELVTECNQLQFEYDSLITAQEQASKETD